MTQGKWRKAPQRPYQPRDPDQVSRAMSSVKSTQNKAEVRLRKELHRRGLRYRLYDTSLPGKPDLVFPKRRLVVFVDGDFWHGRTLIEEGEAAFSRIFRGKNAEWWKVKLERTILRDRRNTDQLQDQGWRVLRIWESDIQRDMLRIAQEIESLVRT